VAVEVVTRARMSEAIIIRVGDEHGPGTDSPSMLVRVIRLTLGWYELQDAYGRWVRR
jgi:hypothetical protein